MLLLAPGPVPIAEDIAELGKVTQLPYFRGEAFAATMKGLTEDLKLLFDTQQTPLTITATGTGLMEMAIVNLLNPGDLAVVINGGTFGHKWLNMLKAFRVGAIDFAVPLGKNPDLQKLEDAIPVGARALVVNAHETSTGYLYDLPALGEIARRKGVLFIVDGVSSIGADAYRMDAWGIDCSMVSTQKALGVMPGIGFIAFSERAWSIIPGVQQPRCYFDAQDYLTNIPRGMTPFTSGMVPILQAKAQLEKLREMGMERYVAQHAERAKAFRDTLFSGSGMEMFPERASNALTAFRLPSQVRASRLVQILKERHDWWLAPNPTKSESYLRVSHMGDFSPAQMKGVAITLKQVVKELLAVA